VKATTQSLGRGPQLAEGSLGRSASPLEASPLGFRRTLGGALGLSAPVQKALKVDAAGPPQHTTYAREDATAEAALLVSAVWVAEQVIQVLVEARPGPAAETPNAAGSPAGAKPHAPQPAAKAPGIEVRLVPHESGASAAVVNLRHPQLGPISLELLLEGRAVQLRATLSNSAAVAALFAQGSALRAALAKHDLQLSTLAARTMASERASKKSGTPRWQSIDTEV